MKIKEIVIPRQLFPHAPAKVRTPVAGRFPVLPLFYVKILPVFPKRILKRLLKPFMLIRTVVHHQIHDNGNPPLFGLPKQAFHVLHASKRRINRIIIRYIIPLIHKGGLIDRRDPDNADPQPLQIIKLPGNPLQIADPVPVRIHKALWIDLIRRFAMPPFFLHRSRAPCFLFL